jgi:hypothetical protein
LTVAVGVTVGVTGEGVGLGCAWAGSEDLIPVGKDGKVSAWMVGLPEPERLHPAIAIKKNASANNIFVILMSISFPPFLDK